MDKHKSIYLQKVKEQNLAFILRRIWEFESVSRVELVQLTGLTSGTITNLTQELLALGIIRESETSSGTVGRKRVNLRYQTDFYRIIGLDIGRTSFQVVITDLAGRILKSAEGNTVGIMNPAEVLNLVEPHLVSMKEFAAGKGLPLLGLGVSIPGPMNQEQGRLYEPPNFPGWENYPLRAELESRFGLRVFMEDDARTSALAELWFGLGRKWKDLVFVTMGIGIGGGIIANGRIVGGANNLYGQVGHMTIVPKGDTCACGNEGCWETVGSIPSILRRWSGGGSTIDDFFRAVRQGELKAKECLNDTLYFLESALTSLFNMYDPELIVLGGRLFPYLSEYLPEIRGRVNSRVFAFASGRVQIEAATFGAFQNTVGAAALVYGNLMQEPLTMIEKIN